MQAQAENAEVRGRREGRRYVLALRGAWTVEGAVPSWRPVVDSLRREVAVQTVCFDLSGLSRFDSVLIAFVLRVAEESERLNLELDRSGLPVEVTRLLELARAVPERAGAQREQREAGLLERCGEGVLAWVDGFRDVCDFVGEWLLGMLRLVNGRSKLRAREFWSVLQGVSVSALPIVSLISFLVGVIISFLGAVTLRRFGAEFAVSYLVGYGMLREMGAVMTGIIMAGRTGAAFAAEIGSMKVNEEIDALRTFGISPMDFIVLPRLLTLLLMMPVLTVYANVIGILSGWVVAEFLMGVPGQIFFDEMNRVVGVGDFVLGIAKAAIFGMLIGASGCLRGLQCGSGADAVGRAATSAVVTGITLIIFANAVIDWIAAILDV